MTCGFLSDVSFNVFSNVNSFSNYTGFRISFKHLPNRFAHDLSVIAQQH